jgi:hypothetical protein
MGIFKMLKPLFWLIPCGILFAGPCQAEALGFASSTQPTGLKTPWLGRVHPITRLLAGKEESTMDMHVNETILLAEAIPSAISAPVPNWLSKGMKPEHYQRAVDDIRETNYRRYRGRSILLAQGPLGIPVLRMEFPLLYRSRPQEISLAEAACYELDILTGVGGAWGPDCVIEKFTKLPKNGMPKSTGFLIDGTPNKNYIYTPTRARTEEVRFILSNGVGRQCEVIVTLRRGESDATGDASDINVPDTKVAQAGNASHGWYLDSTPLDNTDDYLPTADPNIRKAKPGSEAEGKMDMLSVLLHEYGHVLGIEHSADSRDFMAAALQPGERRQAWRLRGVTDGQS